MKLMVAGCYIYLLTYLLIWMSCIAVEQFHRCLLVCQWHDQRTSTGAECVWRAWHQRCAWEGEIIRSADGQRRPTRVCQIVILLLLSTTQL